MARPRFFASRRQNGDDDEDEDTPVAKPSVPDDIVKPAGIENRATPPFGILTELLSGFEDRIRSKGKGKSKKDQLETFFQHWRAQVGPDLYPVVRLMLPERDNRRRTYHLKEQKLGKAYALAMGLPPRSEAALKLEHWKVPAKRDPGGAGEFSTVAYEVVKTRSAVQGRGSMTITDVNDLLDRLSTATSTVGSDGAKRTLQQEHARLIGEALEKMSADEHKFFIRIILKDLKIGLGERTVFEAMHQDAMEHFNTCSDILRVCWTLYDRSFRLPREDQMVKPGSVFRPMLCQRNERNLSDIVKKMAAGRSGASGSSQGPPDNFRYSAEEFIIEEKLDGERIQLHKMGDRYQYSSRKAKDYTYLYGGDKTEGSLTPYIHDLIHPSISEIILDGEMLVWDPVLVKYLPFGNLKTFALQKTIFKSNEPRPCLKVFDVLYIKYTDGHVENCLKKPLWIRKKLLSGVFSPRQGVLEIAEVVKATTAAHISEHLKRILETRGEGLVIKNPESVYVLGGRESTWIKVKPGISPRPFVNGVDLHLFPKISDYMDELGETVDACVIGAYWGQGNRGGGHASFMVGLRNGMDDRSDDVDGEPRFVSFAKVGSGFSLDAFLEIKEQTAGKWIDFDKKKPTPAWFKTMTEFPDQLIKPSDSFVLAIKAAEIVNGVEYGSGLTLRFPRAIMTRDDMDCRSSMTLEDVLKMRSNVGKRTMGSDLRGKNKRFKKPGDKTHHVSTPVDVQVTGDIFKGLIFYVHNLKTAEVTKEDIQALIKAHGGEFIQRIPDPSDKRVVVASEFSGTLTRKKGANAADIVSEAWVVESVKAGRRLPLYKRFYVQALPATQKSGEYNCEEATNVFELLPQRTPAVDSTPDTKMDDFDEAGGVKEKQERTDFSPEARFLESDSQDEDEHVTEDEDDVAGGAPSDVEYNNVDEGGGSPLNDSLGDANVGRNAGPVYVADPTSLTDANPGMGAGLEYGEFDPERMFAPFVGYFDTSKNASLNGLHVTESPAQTVADKYLLASERKFVGAGGVSTTDLQHAALTHIIVSKEFQDRFTSLVRRTSQPRYRKLVSFDWIGSSVDLGELLEESEFKP